MKNNSRDESWVGDTTLRIYERVKNWGKCNHPVGGLIPMSEDHEWEKLKNTLEKYGVNMNKGGLMFCVRWANMFLDASCPIAEEIGYNPIGFTDDTVRMCAESIGEMDSKDWTKDTTSMRKDINNGMRNQIFLNLKEILVRRKQG